MNNNNTPLSISDKAVIGAEYFDDLQLLSEHGFTHIHFSYKWQSREPLTDEEIEQLQQKLEAANLKVLDVHGPHPGGLNISAEDPDERKLAFDAFRQRLKITHLLGGDAMVYHVPEREFNSSILARYIDGLARLEDEARELGVVIALENHYKLENDRITLPACFEKFDPEYIGFTFDPGHASISGNFDWLLENCMERLTILHLNDNNGKSDFHWNPFQQEGIVDWDAAARGIAQSPYNKPLQLEVYWRQDKHDSRAEFLETAAQSAHKLQAQIEQLREKVAV